MATERTTVRLDEHLLQKARDAAKKSGRTLTSLIEEGLQRVINGGSGTQPVQGFRFKTFGGGWYAPGIDPNKLPSDLLKEMDEEDDVEKYGSLFQ